MVYIIYQPSSYRSPGCSCNLTKRKLLCWTATLLAAQAVHSSSSIGAAETSCVHLRKNQTDNFGSSRSFKIDHKFYEKITAQMHKYYRSCAMKHKFPGCPFNGCDLLVMKREREKNPFLLSCCVIYTSLLQRLNIKHTSEDWFWKSFGIKSYQIDCT